MTPTQIGLTIAATCIASLGFMCWLAFTAPHGWEDSDGWHAGEPGEHSDYDGEA